MRWLLLLLLACSETAPRTLEVPGEPETLPEHPPETEQSSVSLWIGGDVLLSEAIRDYANSFDDPAQGFAQILEPMARVWRRDPGAFVLVNLETPVADTRRFEIDAEPVNERGLTAVHLQGPDWLLPGLARSGVDAVSLANNHALDQGREGLGETIAAAKRAGLLVTGAGIFPRFRWPMVLGDQDLELAVLNLYDGRGRGYVEDGDPALSFLEESAYQVVRETADAHTALVVIVHVLGELVDEPEDEWRVWAQRLAEEGADAIIVHGTHVVMPVETIDVNDREVEIAWGLGNLVSDMGRLANPTVTATDPPKVRSAAVHETLIARVELTAQGLSVRYLPAWMSDDRYARWHGALAGDLISFSLLPLSGCAPAVELAGWGQPIRSEVESWITERRDHIVSVTGLRLETCRRSIPVEVALSALPLGAAHGTPLPSWLESRGIERVLP